MRTAYHAELARLTEHLGEMCGLAGVAMEHATQALLHADLVLAEQVLSDHDKIAEHARRWEAAGASHLSLNTMHADLPTTDAHIAALTEMAEVLL